MQPVVEENQDFEAYARTKPFNASISAEWRAAFDEAVDRTGRPAGEVRVFDYGCGDGKYFSYFTARGLAADNIHGADVSQLRVDRCRELGWSQCRTLVPGAPLPYDTASIDIINCMEVIEHIPADEGRRVVGELRRILRPGGMLLISTPNYPIKRFYDFAAAVSLRRLSRLRDDPTHVTFFNHERMNALLSPHFTRIDARPFKQGFLHRRYPRPFFLHKLFFIAQT